MQQLQALIQGKISPHMVHIDQLIVLAENHTNPSSSEYKLLELALNIVLASYLEKAHQYL
jgi:hypothetical protein